MIHLLLTMIYLSFISLGLPDSLLGSAWPSIYGELQIPVSYAGVISIIISVGTIISSLQSGRLTRYLGTGRITALSVAMTAAALMGFSISGSFTALCLWALPYGLGAGSVDAALNNYVALHFSSRHMSWLHCMWGVGASLGPAIMEAALTGGYGWQTGYRSIALLQILLTAILVFSLPLWKQTFKNDVETTDDSPREPLPLSKILFIPGARPVMLLFFCYCAIESTAGLWASSYLVLEKGISAQKAAGWASLFYLGITAGRAVSGFLTLRFSDRQMIRLSLSIIALGILLLFLPLNGKAGLILTGLGCAPIYPSAIHSTPENFGSSRSQAMIGIQMASAYTGTCLMPPLFGLLANHISAADFPFFLALLLAIMAAANRRLWKSVDQN